MWSLMSCPSTRRTNPSVPKARSMKTHLSTENTLGSCLGCDKSGRPLMVLHVSELSRFFFPGKRGSSKFGSGLRGCLMFPDILWGQVYFPIRARSLANRVRLAWNLRLHPCPPIAVYIWVIWTSLGMLTQICWPSNWAVVHQHSSFRIPLELRGRSKGFSWNRTVCILSWSSNTTNFNPSVLIVLLREEIGITVVIIVQLLSNDIT